MVPAIDEKLRAYGLAHRVCGIRTPSTSPIDSPKLAPEELIAIYANLGRQLVRDARVEVLVLGGGPLIGLAPALQERLPVPVIDAVESAVLQAFVLARLRAKKPEVGSFCYPPNVPVVGLDGDLHRLFSTRCASASPEPEKIR
jgi:Asp/Glu/hydantoin racemase